MGKTVVGFEIGNSNLKIAVTNKQGVRIHIVPLPENLVKDGVVKIPSLMSDFLKEVKKEYKIKSGPCGLIMPDSLTIYRSMTLPPMTEKQLLLNLPFEFNDYISDEPENYVYDYSVRELVRDEEDNVTEMKLVAAATAKAKAIEYSEIFKNAGFRLQTIIPQEVAVTNLLKSAIAAERATQDNEYCIINIGHYSTKVYILRGDSLRVVRTINMGGSEFDKAIAEQENVDIFMASTYKHTNYGGVMSKEYIREIYTKLSLEIIKVLNFYYFNNRDSALNRVYFAGGSSNITALCHTIAETTNLVYKPITKLLPENMDETEVANGLLSIGLLMQ